MDINDLSFYCVDCGTVSAHHEVEKKKIPSNVSIRVILECPDCFGTKFEVYSRKSY